jgi:hypothetical protein
MVRATWQQTLGATRRRDFSKLGCSIPASCMYGGSKCWHLGAPAQRYRSLCAATADWHDRPSVTKKKQPALTARAL